MFKLTLVGSTLGSITVNLQVAVNPFAVLAVMVAVPSPLIVTTPLLLTVATEILLLVQVMLLSVALLGNIVAISVYS